MRAGTLRKIGEGKLLSVVCAGGEISCYSSEAGRVTRTLISGGKTVSGGVVHYGQSYAVLSGGGAIIRKAGGLEYVE